MSRAPASSPPGWRVFARCGYHATTMADVAAAVRATDTRAHQQLTELITAGVR
jgi:hypothetical protein